jgi:hypothetical protein
MRFPADRLVPSGGELYAHLFENRATGLSLDVYWSVTVDFEPLDHGGDTSECASTVEWLRLRVDDWRELTGRNIVIPRDDRLAESSFYVGEHLPARTTRLEFRERQADRFTVAIEQLVDLRPESGEAEDAETEVRAVAEVRCRGLLVVPSNLPDVPATAPAMWEAVRPYIDPDAYQPIEPDGDRFILRPRW